MNKQFSTAPGFDPELLVLTVNHFSHYATPHLICGDVIVVKVCLEA